MSSPYFDRAAARYLERSGRFPWRLVRSAEWRALRDALRLSPGLDVLDLGCGAGYYSLRIRATADVRIHGVDASPSMMSAYRAQGFEGTCCRAETFTGSRPFDRILAAGLFEFVDDPERTFENLARLLRGGGRLVCLIPNPGLLGELYKAFHAIRSCPTRVWDLARYSRLAERHGFALRDCARASFLGSVLGFEAAEALRIS